MTDGYGNNRVVLFDKNGKFIKQVAKGAGGPTDKGTGPGEWNLPHKLAVDAEENLYVIDREGHRIEVFDKNLNYIREVRNDWNPWDVNISRKGTDGIGWIADHKDERVLKFSLKDGKILAVWGKQGWGPGEFDWVHGIVVDSKGAVYPADTYGQRLQKFVPAATSSNPAAAVGRHGNLDSDRDPGVGAECAQKVDTVSVTGCLREASPGKWTLVNATDPVVSTANAPPNSQIPATPPVGTNRSR